MYQNLLFEQPLDLQLTAFYNTSLGQLHQAIPFSELSKQVSSPARAISDKGCKPWFDIKGGIALQILKSYYRCSDAMLIEQLNGNWRMQMFCGILLRQGEQIKDKDIVGRWRSHLSNKLDMDKLQMSCVQHWKLLWSIPIQAFVMLQCMRVILNILRMPSCYGEVAVMYTK